MKGIIIYMSTYGSTRQYAEWLHQDTGYPVFEYKKITRQELEDTKIVIIGCPVLKHQPSLAKWIKSHWPWFKDKKVLLFTTSGTLPNDPGLRKEFLESLPQAINTKIEYYPFGGRMIYQKLKRLHKFFIILG